MSMPELFDKLEWVPKSYIHTYKCKKCNKSFSFNVPKGTEISLNMKHDCKSDSIDGWDFVTFSNGYNKNSLVKFKDK